MHFVVKIVFLVIIMEIFQFRKNHLRFFTLIFLQKRIAQKYEFVLWLQIEFKNFPFLQEKEIPCVRSMRL